MSPKLCGLFSSTNTADATTHRPLRPRVVKLREAIVAVRKLVDESAQPFSGPPPHSSPNKTKTKNCKTRNPRSRNESDRRRFDDKHQYSKKWKQHDKGESNLKALQTETNRDFQWAREDQLSVILEILESEAGTRKNTPNWSEKLEAQGQFPLENNLPIVPETSAEQVWIGNGKGKSVARSTIRAVNLPRSEKGSIDLGKGASWLKETSIIPEVHKERRRRPSWDKVRFEHRILEQGEQLLYFYEREARQRTGKMSEARTPESPRPIQSPPRDPEAIQRIDDSLVFEHFTTEDAWLLGSALRTRLLGFAKPAVINISLANQNQTLFHACTHSGVMPDNDSWVARKRKTVLRWGCSTWYMRCKFEGDELLFKEKFGLGNSAGEYAIHGGGVPIRVTGVEGVVAVVVVSGLKQEQDHGVIVEVIRELYY